MVKPFRTGTQNPPGNPRTSSSLVSGTIDPHSCGAVAGAYIDAERSASTNGTVPHSPRVWPPGVYDNRALQAACDTHISEWLRLNSAGWVYAQWMRIEL